MSEGRGAGSVIGLAAATGLLVATRAVIALDLPDPVPLLVIRKLPMETLGIAWTDTAIWPAELQRTAARRLLGTLGVLGLASVVVALLNVATLLMEAAASRRRDLAVRVALGATPGALVLRLLAEVRTLVGAGFSIGLLAGLAGGVLTRALWPHGTVPVTAAPPLDIGLGLAALLVVVSVAHTAGAWRLARGHHTIESLKSGGRATDDVAAIFGRNVLSAVHTTVAGTVVLCALVLLPAVTKAGSGRALVGADDVYVVEARLDEGARWDSIMAAVAAVPGLEAESLAAPGALFGLGVRDLTVSQCGACVRGLFPAPLWNSLSDHHSVGPGFFELSGLEVIDGRTFRESDDSTGPRVAVVSERLARTAFEAGQPLGKQIQVGGDTQRWYTVVGVVADRRVAALGLDGTTRPAVYLSAFQREPRFARVLLRGTADAADLGHALISASASEVSDPVVLSRYVTDQARVQAWSGRIASMIAALVVLVAAHGIYLVTVQTTRRRASSFAIRRALGATSRDIVRQVVSERLRVTSWGLAGLAFFGTLALAFIQTALGLGAPGWTTWALLALGLLVLALVASLRAAREAVDTEPARLIE